MSNIIEFTRWVVGSALLASAVGLGLFGIAAASRDVGIGHEHRSEQMYDRGDDSGDDDADGAVDHGQP